MEMLGVTMSCYSYNNSLSFVLRCEGKTSSSEVMVAAGKGLILHNAPGQRVKISKEITLNGVLH